MLDLKRKIKNSNCHNQEEMRGMHAEQLASVAGPLFFSLFLSFL